MSRNRAVIITITANKPAPCIGKVVFQRAIQRFAKTVFVGLSLRAGAAVCLTSKPLV